MKQKSILIGLNELNFQFIKDYIALGSLPNFKRLFNTYGIAETTSENEYHLLEPWIQWVSIHTGKSYTEHQVYRLGDIVNRPDLEQVWEVAEKKGLTVGAVSPFNARNNLKQPLFFVPDPWTQTTAAGSSTLVGLSEAVSSAVNNNASNKMGIGTLVSILKGFLSYVPVSRYLHYMALASRPSKKVTKPAILDNLLADTFIESWKNKKPDFASLFMNSGAHIQHHYMFNSKAYKGSNKNPEWYCPSNEDPLFDILSEYDSILGRLMELNCRLFIATGLHQNPHNENTFYWRLTNHNEFLALLDIRNYKRVVPRMSRDFLVECNDATEAKNVQRVLEEVFIQGDDENVFTVDNRGESLFVELTYSKDIKAGTAIVRSGKSTAVDLSQHVSFVAIKNGEHDGIGYFIDTGNPANSGRTLPVQKIFSEMVSSFN